MNTTSDKSNCASLTAWAHKGRVRYLENAEPIDENDFLLDDIDYLRETDIFGRKLKKAGDSE